MTKLNNQTLISLFLPLENRNTAKQFFTAAQVFDMTAVFGELSDELAQKSKYAKWRAAYIIKCIKNGEKPLPPEDETKNEQPASNEFSEQPPAYNASGSAVDDEKADYDIGQPPAAPNFNDFNDFNLNQINNLTINSPKPSVPPSQPASSHYSNPVDYSSAATSDQGQALSAMNGIRISQDDILKAQKYSKWASSALDYEDVKTAVGNLQKALNILTRGRED